MAYFPEIDKIRFEGPDSNNPLAFRHYNPDEVVEGKTMKEHLRFAVCYWHTFRGTGGDPFGPGCAVRPWEDGTDSVEMALKRVSVAFEFMEKLGAPYYCFHDRDVAPEGKNLRETNANLDKVAKALKEEQQRTGIKLLWGTANLFSNPRFVHGAATSCNADVFAYAAAQVKKCLEVTKELGGENYVFWGGREGYSNLYNTDLKRELDHLAKFLHLAVDYKKKIGFTGQFLIEPKPKEPTKHQYDFDVANVHRLPARLRPGGYVQAQRRNQPRHAGRPHDDARADLCVHQRHARLHRRQPRRPAAGLGHRSVPDRHLSDDAVHAGDPGSRRTRRPAASTSTPRSAAKASSRSICSTPTSAAWTPSRVGLKIAAAIRADGVLRRFRQEALRLLGRRHRPKDRSGQANFEDLEKYMLEKGDAAKNVSGRQEMLENIINRYLR